MKKIRISIIGKCPPPIGGVTMHVKRLLEWLNLYGFNYKFYNLDSFSLISLCALISKSYNAHLHSSSPYLRFIFSIMCILFQTKSIITFHGNLGRYGKVKNFFDILSVKLCSTPILLNQNSYVKALRYNQNSLLQSAYIPEINDLDLILDQDIEFKINRLRKRSKLVACTNAYNVSYDSVGNDIYGIAELLHFFSRKPEFGLIISDPSGNYYKMFASIPSNILFINRPHPFLKVLEFADCFIRYTTTDGDSISIHEAMDMGVPVIATNVVERPKGVLLVKRGDFLDLEKKICQLFNLDKTNRILNVNIKEPDILKLYKSF